MSAPSPRVRIAMIGCGAVAHIHGNRLLRDPRAVIAVCCDPSLEHAARFAKEFSPSAIVETVAEKAIQHPDLDAVILCSPTQAHHEQVTRALARGLHVLCEKPLAANRDEILDLIAARDRAQRVLAVSYQRRYEAPYVTAWRELHENRDTYGQIHQIHVFVCERWQQTIAGTWRDDPRVGSGYFGDAGSHQIDTCFYLTGSRPEAVFARSQKHGSQVEIVTQVMARLSDGIELFAHFVGNAHHWREDIHLHGQKADLLLRSERLFRAANNNVEEITDLLPVEGPDYAFIDSIVEGRPTPSPAECALPMIDWTTAVLESARTQRWVENRSPSSLPTNL